ncbi:hypothetical protein ACNRBS_15405 [Ralstonia pseudosolanacearum]|uniref:Transposase n=1 Tax=Ralstonia solanacearum TaxID=305 RepID=A0A8D5J5P8_RALSL|nr:hypothetical protein [Ralstonia pseudosolanacearum]BCI56286.1 hypothetical protein 14 [Ralstonia solanacearum]
MKEGKRAKSIVSIKVLGGHVNTIEESAPTQCRRRLNDKAKAAQDCMQQGVSIAVVAMRYRLHANLLRRWVAEQEGQGTVAGVQEGMTAAQAEFIPL